MTQMTFHILRTALSPSPTHTTFLFPPSPPFFASHDSRGRYITTSLKGRTAAGAHLSEKLASYGS